MKRTLLALVCVLALFASCNKEKPNEKFIGNYEADNMELKATISTTATLPGGIENMFNGQELPVSFDDVDLIVTAGSKKNEVTAVMTIEDDSYTFNGTCSGDVIDFEQTTIHILASDVAVVGSNFDITAVIDASAKLNSEGQLLYSGTFTGTGNITAPNLVPGLTVPITMENGKIEMTIFEPDEVTK